MTYLALLLVPIVVLAGTVLDASQRQALADKALDSTKTIRASISARAQAALDKTELLGPEADTLPRRLAASALRLIADMLSKTEK